jgi:hypothetical protein
MSQVQLCRLMAAIIIVGNGYHEDINLATGMNRYSIHVGHKSKFLPS